MANIRTPSQTGWRRNSTRLLGLRDRRCLRSFQEQRSRESHMQFSKAHLSYKYCWGQNQPILSSHYDPGVNSQVSYLGGQCPVPQDTQYPIWSIGRICMPPAHPAFVSWRCNQKALLWTRIRWSGRAVLGSRWFHTIRWYWDVVPISKSWSPSTLFQRQHLLWSYVFQVF